MEVIPVLDVCGGVAVHARGGDRAAYRPVRSVLAEGSDPIVLARAYRDRLGARSCYLADLDAIAGAPPNLSLIRAVADEGLRLWVDAGIRDGASARAVLDAGAHRAIVALETIPRQNALASVAADADPDSLAFSLDLRNEEPLANWKGPSTEPAELAGSAYRSGYRDLIILELGRVGTQRGAAWGLLSRLRERCPEARLYVGGGIRDRSELRRLADAGCVGALVATALHEGRITREDVQAVHDR